MKLHPLPSGPIQTISYLLTDAARGEAVLIDASGDIWSRVGPILEREGVKLGALWITHGHWDHTQGAAEVVRRTAAPVSGHPDDRVLFEQPMTMAAFMDGITLEPVKIDHWLRAPSSGEALGVPYEVRHVPGHCPGNVMFYFPRQRAAFVGDALFNRSVGRTDFPGGDFAQLERSIREQIYVLPDETVVYPGHGLATTVGAEKANNPYVKAA